MKKLFTLLTTAAVLCNMFAVTSFAEESDKPTSNTAITAVKTAQWRATESDSTTYDLRIHGWSGWETAAYMGFELTGKFTIVEKCRQGRTCTRYNFCRKFGNGILI